MTSANVSDVPILMNLGQTQLQSAAKSENSSNQFQDLMFANLQGMDLSATSNQFQTPETTTQTTNCQVVRNVNIANESKETVVRSEDVVKERKAISDFVTKTNDVLEEELDVTEEEIVAAMEALGIGYVDLLDPNNLTKLISELSADNTIQLLVSDTVSNILEQVQSFGVELLSQVDMDFSMLKTVENMDGGFALNLDAENFVDLGDITVTPAEVTPQEETPIDTVDMPTILPQETTDVPEDVVEIVVEQKEEVLPQTGTNPTNTNLEVDVTDDMAEDLEEGLQNVIQNTGEKKEADSNENQSSSEFMGRKTTKTPLTAETTRASESQMGPSFSSTVTEVVNTTETVTTYTTSIDTRDIIQQIVSQAKVTITNQVTTMEMELNPQNLGRMILNVAENDGKVTAHITLQNEAVRHAMETQMAVIKENLNQQGIKVEAVEVTVGTHEFERNLEEGQTKQEQASEEHQQGNAPRRTNINLNNLDELSGLMTEEEALVASMMRDAGNSINFTA